MARGLTFASGATFAALAVVAALGTSGCAGSDGLALAQDACGHVARSISYYHNAERDPRSPSAPSEQDKALDQLRIALPLAATAAGEAPQWQALMTTLSDSTRLPESELVYALQAQCAVASDNGSEPPPPPTTTPA